MQKSRKIVCLLVVIFFLFNLCSTTLYAAPEWLFVDIFQCPGNSGDSNFNVRLSPNVFAADKIGSQNKSVTMTVYDNLGNKYASWDDAQDGWPNFKDSRTVSLPANDGYRLELNANINGETSNYSKEFKVSSLPEIKIKDKPVVTGNRISFSWEQIIGSTRYWVFTSKDPSFDNPEMTEDSGDSTYIDYDLIDLNGSQKWYAYVLAERNGTQIACSPVLTLDIPADYPISYTDKNMERVIRKAIQKPVGEILKSDLDKITELNAPNQGLFGLQNIEYLTNLETLYMPDNLILSTNQISTLKKLKKIDLSNNLISSCNGLTSMPCLTELNLSNNNILDIPPMEKNTTLVKLDISSNFIRNIDSLKSLVNITSLKLSGNPVTDFSPVSEFYNNITDKDFILDNQVPTSVNTTSALNSSVTTTPTSYMVYPPTPTPTSDPIAFFPDKNLENVIRVAINKPTGDIEKRDLLNITQLDASGKNISNIEGIQYLTNLKVLNLNNNKISDLQRLNELYKLKILCLSGNNIFETYYLNNLTNLNLLYLSDNHIRDVDIGNLSKLNALYIAQNDIQNIYVINAFPNLLEFVAFNNQIHDMSPITSHKDMMVLSIGDNYTSAIGINSDFYYLNELYIDDLPLTSIDVIYNLPNLEKLSLSNTGLEDYSGLRSLKNLKYLGLGENNISDISFLSGMTNLEELYLQKNKNIKNIEVIANFKNLRVLYLWDNNINNISSLSGLTNLNNLELSSNKIEDITSLSLLVNLDTLYISNNSITNINSLRNLALLKTLYLGENKIVDYSPVYSFYSNLSDKDFEINIPVSNITIFTKSLTINKNTTPKVLTRARFVSFLVKTFNLKDDQTIADPQFSDVASNSSIYRDICIVYKAKLLTGFRDNTYRPDATITRAEYAVVIANALKYNYTKNTPINDIAGHWAEKYISTIVDAGLMILDENNCFKPDNDMLLNDEGQLIPIISPVDAANKKIIWKSSNEKVAIVDQTGQVIGISPGDTEITAVSTVDRKVSGPCYVKVNGDGSDPGTVNPSPGVVPGIILPSASPIITLTPTPSPVVTPSSTPTISSTPTPTKEKAAVEDVDQKPGSISYTDIKGHWAEKYINELLEKSIISGYPDGTIKPDSEVSRAEIAVLLAKAVGLKPDDQAGASFTDAKDIPGWAKGYINAAYKKGIIKGYSDGKFLPSNKLSRKEFVVMAVRAFELGELAEQLSFSDIKNIPEWARGSIAKAVKNEIVKGYSDNTFRPDKNVTRAEVFTVINKCMH